MSISNAFASKALNKPDEEFYESTSSWLKQEKIKLAKLIDKYSIKIMANIKTLAARGVNIEKELKGLEKLPILKKTLKNTDLLINKMLTLLVSKASKKTDKKKNQKKKVKSSKPEFQEIKSPKALVKSKKLLRSGIIRKQAHAKSRTRRSQGKKDSR